MQNKISGELATAIIDKMTALRALVKIYRTYGAVAPSAMELIAEQVEELLLKTESDIDIGRYLFEEDMIEQGYSIQRWEDGLGQYIRSDVQEMWIRSKYYKPLDSKTQTKV